MMSEPTPTLFADIESTGRFVRDTSMGGMLHHGTRSYRELRAVDAVHLCVDGNRVTAHVDQVSPLNLRRGGRFRYSVAAVVAHAVEDVGRRGVRRLMGRATNEHCHLDCEIVWVDDDDEAGVGAGAEAGADGSSGKASKASAGPQLASKR